MVLQNRSVIARYYGSGESLVKEFWAHDGIALYLDFDVYHTNIKIHRHINQKK